MLTFNRTRIDNRARCYLQRYLAGRNEADHPPLSPEEIAQVYRMIRREVAERVERE